MNGVKLWSKTRFIQERENLNAEEVYEKWVFMQNLVK